MPTPADLDPHRLPADAAPTRYDVRLRPSLADARFSGSVVIALDVRTPVDRLVLNAADLTIRACRVDGVDAGWELDAETERMTVTPVTPLAGGAAELAVEFDGVLNDKLRGFYRSTYVDDDGVEQVIATTQMQSTDCRRAFPCWDEPELKAVFGITLEVDDGLTAISNGPEVERTLDDGRWTITFADTMPMSSYLVAFVVGRLEATAPVDVDGVPLRIVHVPGKERLTAFGLEIGAFALRWFQEYYDIPYPSDKVDLVALPDFAAGAMENLGCITFRESVLLVDPETSTQHERQLVADVVSHELAHMWFGDLVTMRWWNGIWLNEAFATFMEVAACDAFRPEWERWTSFGLERSTAFDTDSLDSTRPVEYEVRSPADAEGMFDAITYEKGGALLRMLEQYLGEQRFRDGIRHYLRTHRYGNTETSDLWDALETTTGEPVRRLMDSWIWQPGYPLVSATLASTEGGADLVLTQRRFRFESPPPESAGEATWVVPVHVLDGGSEHRLLLDGDAGPARVPLEDPDGVVVVNAGGHGFFRVAYDAALRTRLTGEALASLTTVERYGLIDDAWAATVAGDMTAGELLEFLEGFADEREHAVWQAIVVALRGLDRLVDGPAADRFRARVRALVGPALAELGEPADGERDLTRKLRGLLIGAMGTLGDDPATVERARSLFQRAREDPTSVDAELASAATAVVARHGDQEAYEQMLDGFAHAPTPQDQLRYLFALAGFDDAGLVQRTCELAMTDRVKTQNAPFLLRALIANRHHGPAAWAFVRSRWTEADERFPRNTIVRMVESVKLLDTPAQVEEVRGFFAEHPIEQATKTLEQILERQRINSAMRTREHERFANTLSGHSPI